MTVQQLPNRLARCGPWIELAGVSCFAGFLAALWVGLLLAEAGRFAAWIALLAAVAVGAVVWRRFRRKMKERPASEAHSGGVLAAVALALLSLAFTIPPSEWIVGGWDPGVYVHTAASLARGGSLRPEFPDLASLDADTRALLGRQGQEAWEPFIGMRMMRDGSLSPQFYHLYPVLMALVWPFGGVRAALMVNPLLNAICIVALYLWASRWMKRRWALAAALVLALNPAQVWQARFCTSEMLTQCLLMGGLVLMGRALSGRTKDLLEALLAGSAFGLAMLARYDTVLFVTPLSLVLLMGWRDKPQRPQLLAILGATGALGAQTWLHQRYLAPLYHPGGGLVAQGLLAAGILAVLIVVVVVWMPRRTFNDGREAPEPQRWPHVAVAAAFVAWVFLYWYVRPRLAVNGHVLEFFTWLYPGLKEAEWFPILAGRHAKNFWYLQSLFGGPGLVAALAGIAILIFRARTVWRTAWLAAAVGVLVMLMTFIYHEPFMMFISRRLIPVIIPLLCLGAAAACDGVESVLRMRPRLGVAAAGWVLVLTVMFTFRGTAFLARHREWPGLTGWYDQLAARIPPGARVYSDQPGFAAPLRFIYGIRAYELRAVPPDRQTDQMVMMMKQAKQDTVLWLTQTKVPEAQTAQVIPAGDLPLESSILGTTKHEVPRYVRGRGGAFKLYRILPSAGSAAAPDA